MKARNKKFVTFRAGSMGDCLMGKYFLELLREEHTHGEFFIIVSCRQEMINDLLAAYPWIKVVELNRRKPWQLLKSLIRLRGTEVTATPTSLGTFSNTSKLFARLITKRGGLIGFDDGSKLVHVLYDTVLQQDKDRSVYKNDCLLAEAVTSRFLCSKPTHTIVPDKRFLEPYGLCEGNYIVLNMFSGSPQRGLSLENKMRLVTAVLAGDTKSKVIITGSMNDKPEAEKLLGDPRVQVVAGPIDELQNLLYFAKGVVSIDTGTAHISSGLGKPLVVLCSYAARAWWQADQHPDTTVVFIGEPSSTERITPRKIMHPPSLNNFSSKEITEKCKEAFL